MTLTQSVSSEKSPQSLSESHLNVLGMHLPLSHWNWSFLQVIFVQFLSSSELSRQSSSPSQTHVFWMHLPFAQVKSQGGQECASGTESGSSKHFLPSSASFSPRGQSHWAFSFEVVLSGTGKQNFSHSCTLGLQGWSGNTVCALSLYILIPYSLLLSSTSVITFSCDPSVLFILRIASLLQSVTYNQSV